MAERKSPVLRKRRLGRRVRQLREQSGMSLDEAAARLDKSRSSLHRIESGETRADVHLARSMMDLYDIYDDSLIELARDAGKHGWWRAYGIEDKGYIGMETEAGHVLTWQLAYIPGLLQTEAYMRTLFCAGPPRDADRLEKDVRARQYRQQRLTDSETALRVDAIVDEAVLHRPIGGLDRMREQLRHLVECAALPGISLQVLPHGPEPHGGMSGAFTVLRFEDPEDPDLLYLDYPAGSFHVEKQEEVQATRLVFDRLRSKALSSEESVALIERVAVELQTSLDGGDCAVPERRWRCDVAQE